MPIRIPDRLPAKKELEKENIFVINEFRASHQDIRPLKIAILNLMPTKIVTETQLIRLLSNTPLQIDLTLLKISSHTSKNTSPEHLEAFYRDFDNVKEERFDGIIITGAPVENLSFHDVDYWDKLCEIIDWTKTNVHSCFYICWGAQACLYYRYKIEKFPLEKKMFGVFKHRVLVPDHPLLRGFDEEFLAPHSRNSYVKTEDIINNPKLILLAASEDAGAYLIASKSKRNFFALGHCEYDYDTLAKEYFRDIEKGLDISVPYNYFPDNDPTLTPKNNWRAHAHHLFSNWLNYFVYQETPFNLSDLKNNNF